jgi:hypothetical protein
MAAVNLSEAARLARVTRQTLYRHIKKGKLSATALQDGGYEVDTAELLRVYGVIQQEVDTELQHDTGEVQGNLQRENEFLQSQIQAKDELLKEKEKRIVDLQQMVRLLEHRPAVEPGDAALPTATAKVAELAVKLQEQAAVIEAERIRTQELQAALEVERQRGFFSRLFGGKR